MSTSTITAQVPSGNEQLVAAGRGRAGARVLALGALVAVALAGALVAGTLPRLKREHQVNAAAADVAAAPPRVTVVAVRRMASAADRVLPGSSLPLLEASMYARATGYIESRLVDIGDRVQEGQLLAVIAAPDIDDQLAQAKANLAQSKANLKLAEANANLAKIIYERDITLGPSVSQQLVDKDRASAQVSAAQVEAARASIHVYESTVQRYTDLTGFEKIIAPFPGVITARNIEKGDLVSADSTTRELYHIMRTDTLRVFVNVPQVFSTGIKVGQNAIVYQRETPLKQLPGKVARTADALDPSTRTLLTEVDVPNPKDALRAGMYLQVKFVFDRQNLPILIPAAALVTRPSGQQVAVLDAQHRVQYRTVQLGRDFGAEIEVIAGLKGDETVVVHPGDALPAGTIVEPVAPPKK